MHINLLDADRRIRAGTTKVINPVEVDPKLDMLAGAGKLANLILT